jgi:nitrite reductase/ring-hydroxylating ferredoxin subunit
MGRRERYPSNEEVEQALGRLWQPLVRRAELGAGPRRVSVLGVALVVFLTESGEAAVLADRCPHRGASLAGGEVSGSAIRCPYHGWEWEAGDGRCTRIPSLADQNLIPPAATARAYPVCERWGMVWGALEEPVASLPEAPWLDQGEWALAHGEPFELPVSFGVMIENFRDVAHFAFVHAQTLGEIEQVVEPLKVEGDGILVRMRREMIVGEGAEESWGSLREIEYLSVAPNFIAARLFFSGGGERCLLHAARAITGSSSIHFWVAGIEAGYTGHQMAEVIEFERRLYEEDCETVSTVTPPELPLDPGADLNTLADAFTLAYRRAYLEFVDRALAA